MKPRGAFDIQVGGKPLEKRPLIGNPTFKGLDAYKAMQPAKVNPAAAAGGSAMPMPQAGAGRGAFDAYVDEQFRGSGFKASTRGKPGWRVKGGAFSGMGRDEAVGRMRDTYAGLPDAEKAKYERMASGADLDQSTAVQPTTGMDSAAMLPFQPEQGPMMAPDAAATRPTTQGFLAGRRKKRPMGAFGMMA